MTLEARGGRRGGAGTPAGEEVIVVFDGRVLDVFHETGVERFHAAMVEAIELVAHPGPAGWALQISAPRYGCMIPVRFEGDQRAALDQIIAAVRETT